MELEYVTDSEETAGKAARQSQAIGDRKHVFDSLDVNKFVTVLQSVVLRHNS